MSRDVKEFQRKVKKMSWNDKVCQGMPRDVKGCQGMPRDVKKLYGI